jgi:hypothetical protein
MDPDTDKYVDDETTVYSLGVAISRALSVQLGIDDDEIDFGVKQEMDNGMVTYVLFIFDTAKGGCGYSTSLSEPDTCQRVFDLALTRLESATCCCEEGNGACTNCLIDRRTTRYSNLLSKARALYWLKKQRAGVIQVPENVIAVSPNAQASRLSLKECVSEIINSDTRRPKDISFFVTSAIEDISVTDFASQRTQIGSLIHHAIAKGINVSINIEYDENNVNERTKAMLCNLDQKIPDCNIRFIAGMGNWKTALSVKYDNNTFKRYFTDDANALLFSDNWGEGSNIIYFDDVEPTYQDIQAPVFDNHNENGLVHEIYINDTKLKIQEYYKHIIAPLNENCKKSIRDILTNKNVEITYSDRYVNSALAALMLTYLIYGIKDEYNINISTIRLNLNWRGRACNNLRFDESSYISRDFGTAEDADNYINDLMYGVLGIQPIQVNHIPDHYRWLKIMNNRGEFLEIRPDHGISGAWTSQQLYMNLESLDGNLIVSKNNDNEPDLYYIIIHKL